MLAQELGQEPWSRARGNVTMTNTLGLTYHLYLYLCLSFLFAIALALALALALVFDVALSSHDPIRSSSLSLVASTSRGVHSGDHLSSPSMSGHHDHEASASAGVLPLHQPY